MNINKKGHYVIYIKWACKGIFFQLISLYILAVKNYKGVIP